MTKKQNLILETIKVIVSIFIPLTIAYVGCNYNKTIATNNERQKNFEIALTILRSTSPNDTTKPMRSLAVKLIKSYLPDSLKQYANALDSLIENRLSSKFCGSCFVTTGTSCPDGTVWDSYSYTCVDDPEK